MKFFHHDRPFATRSEEWIVTLLSFWFTAGLYLDGWAHNHLDSALETFFTPWHGVFYSGYLVLALALTGLVVRRKRYAKPWKEAVPQGYGWSLIGAGLFVVGGIGDMLWHFAFGIEADIDALLSPTHLILAISMLLMITGPLRSWYLRAKEKDAPSFPGQLPMLLSAAFALSLITFMTQFNHFVAPTLMGVPPMDAEWADDTQALAISGYLFQALMLMGLVFLLMRRARLAPGALTLVFTLNMLGMVLMRDNSVLLISMAFAGIVADLLAPSSRPVEGNERAFRLFAFVVPAALFLAYFLTVIYSAGTWWSIHLWTGSVVIAGIAGVLLSYVALPPREKAGS
jgi:hypothetical protein